MPDPRSALASVTSGAVQLTAGLSCFEAGFADLVMASAWPETEAKVFGAVAATLGTDVPADCLVASHKQAASIFRVAPRKLMVVSEDRPLLPGLTEVVSGEDGAISGLGHSRVRIRLQGAGAAALLARGMAIDLDEDVFPAGRFAQTNIHHIWVLVHRIAGDTETFDIYVLRSFALSFWHWLVDAAKIATQSQDGVEALAS